jgi:hypothetical protein
MELMVVSQLQLRKSNDFLDIESSNEDINTTEI